MTNTTHTQLGREQQISEATTFDQGDRFTSDEQVREFFTVENLSLMGLDEVPDQDTLDCMADDVIANRWHLVVIDYAALLDGTRDVDPATDPWPKHQRLMLYRLTGELWVQNDVAGGGWPATDGDIPLGAVPGNLTPTGGRQLADHMARVESMLLELCATMLPDEALRERVAEHVEAFSVGGTPHQRVAASDWFVDGVTLSDYPGTLAEAVTGETEAASDRVELDHDDVRSLLLEHARDLAEGHVESDDPADLEIARQWVAEDAR